MPARTASASFAKAGQRSKRLAHASNCPTSLVKFQAAMLLHTPRLAMRQLQAQDWPVFHRLHSEPNVLSHVADPMSDEQVWCRFDERLPLWAKETSQWLCLVMDDWVFGQLASDWAAEPTWQGPVVCRASTAAVSGRRYLAVY
jgi:hypothetical protein